MCFLKICKVFELLSGTAWMNSWTDGFWAPYISKLLSQPLDSFKWNHCIIKWTAYQSAQLVGRKFVSASSKWPILSSYYADFSACGCERKKGTKIRSMETRCLDLIFRPNYFCRVCFLLKTYVPRPGSFPNLSLFIFPISPAGSLWSWWRSATRWENRIWQFISSQTIAPDGYRFLAVDMSTPLAVTIRTIHQLTTMFWRTSKAGKHPQRITWWGFCERSCHWYQKTLTH